MKFRKKDLIPTFLLLSVFLILSDVHVNIIDSIQDMLISEETLIVADQTPTEYSNTHNITVEDLPYDSPARHLPSETIVPMPYYHIALSGKVPSDKELIITWQATNSENEPIEALLNTDYCGFGITDEINIKGFDLGSFYLFSTHSSYTEHPIFDNMHTFIDGESCRVTYPTNADRADLHLGLYSSTEEIHTLSLQIKDENGKVYFETISTLP